MENKKKGEKKILSFKNIVILITFFVVLIFLFIRIIPSRYSRGAILEIIPVDASIIVKTNDFNKLFRAFQDNDFWREVINFNALGEFKETVGYLDSLLTNNENLYNSLSNETFISFHLTGKEKIKPVFYISLKKVPNYQVRNHIELILKGIGTLSDRKYENITIYDALILKDQQKFSFFFYNGNIILSSSSILAENAVRQIYSDDKISKQKGFRKVSETGDNSALANIFINYKTIAGALKIAFNHNFRSKIRSKNNIAEWTELDLTLKSQLLLLNGFTYSSDSLNNIENILIGQTPRKFTLHNVFPTTTNSFYSILMSDPVLFKKSYREYLLRVGSLSKYEASLTKYKKEYNTDFEDLAYNIIENEMGEVQCNMNNEENQNENFFIINTRGKNTTLELLMDLIKNWAKNENRGVDQYKIIYKIDEGASYDIYRFPVSTLMSDLFEVFYDFNSAHYFTLIDNYLVFSENHQSLSKLIYANVLNKTLDKSFEYTDFTEYVNNRSNLFYYLKIPKSKEIIEKYFNSAITGIYHDNPASFEKINTLAYQISGADELLYNNIIVNYISKTYDDPVTEWETLLDTSLNFKPVLVKNHYTKENEIFVQDLNNTIYLINNSGRITWKHKLDEKINSEVFQIDYYKNGKLQLMFSTATALHLIDRNGNYVERYPVKLRDDATAGMAIFDYDKDRNYRIFIPCENKKIYAYSLDGNIIPGWQFGNTDHPVLNPVQHFKIENKDYIVLADKNKVYILDRQGNTRVKPDKLIPKSKNNLFYPDNSVYKNRLITTDTSGNIIYFYLDGKVEINQTENFGPDHFFEFEDINADGTKDFIFINNKNLRVFNQNYKEILTYIFTNEIRTKPIYFHFSSNDRKLGILNAEKEEIYLINNNGELYKGFPLTGNSLFSIGMLENKNGRFNLIVGGKNNYLYNYSVN